LKAETVAIRKTRLHTALKIFNAALAGQQGTAIGAEAKPE